jgi:Xaa-Pro aminopeptidase
MRYQPINSSLFKENRKRLASKLKPSSIAILQSNDIPATNADGSTSFIQNADLFYLSGIDQEESILVICPDLNEGKHKEILFIKETSELIAIWEGSKYSKEEAKAASGVDHVYWVHEFESVLTTLIFLAEHIYLNTNEHIRAAIETETRSARLIKWCKAKYPLHKYERLAPIMQDLRSIKSQIEIDLIQHACNITEKGFRRLLKFVKPGVWEYEIEAELSHEFLRNRSKGFAYTPIIASGYNACVLHYIQNDAQCKDGDVLLMDVAAEYANYKSDLTRSIPVNGKFTKRQKDVYNAVLNVFNFAKSRLIVGNIMGEYQKEVGDCMQEELIKVGLLNAAEVKKQDPEKPLYKKYFMHGTSHHLGIDVHDLGDKYKRFEAGMVYTIEPGIYIREENLGIRIENNFVITDKGNFDLMGNIPILADDIESEMNAS